MGANGDRYDDIVIGEAMADLAQHGKTPHDIQKFSLDRFDSYYQHLFLWQHAKQELVGAYRLGFTDQILKQYGPKGLYTNQLFRFKPEFVQQLSTAIEFGRSFIRSEYQKKLSNLLFLWKAVGAPAHRGQGVQGLRLGA